MNKTIYIRDCDAEVWEQAKKLTHGKVSQLIVDSLRGFVLRAEKSGALKSVEEAESKIQKAKKADR